MTSGVKGDVRLAVSVLLIGWRCNAEVGKSPSLSAKEDRLTGGRTGMDKATTDGIKRGPAFTRYQAFVIAVLAFLQFSVILDFMIISPLGAMMMPTLHMSPQQFGLAVSSYAFSAGASGLLAAGFADRFDRKRLLMFFYTGFIIGTFLCAIAPDYEFLLMARIVTGIFGGVIGS